MKPKYLIVFVLLFALKANSQNAPVLDYKVKTVANAKERTEMLDALRAHLYKNWKMTMEFYVSYFKVSNNYAWFEGTADRKDGKEIKLEGYAYDCCHVEALFKKQGSKWIVAQGAAFSTDVWYEAISKRYPAVPKAIFPPGSAALLDQ